ncbi:unnamed protein product [Adineta ricciae]|uniref:Uncharacterized protein n=1 Tax=Adineta ricciae TaxID=249248 RepID=A0A815RVH1_ADIRI|nr:unnamed protein product [Adineta ricciae]CAF1518754.1 unnamed protein product [Adineta ricciae]
MFLALLVLLKSCLVLAVNISHIQYGIYVPQPTSVAVSFTMQFSIDCNECLCAATSSNTTSYAVVNCQKDTHWCSFYSVLTSNYSVQWNVQGSVYFLQSFPMPSTSIPQTSQPTTMYVSTQAPLSNVWIQTNNMSVPRIGHTSTYIPETGNVLIAGGENQSSLELFIPSNRSFITKGSMTTIRAYHSADRLNTNLVLIAGGTTADLYDPINEVINVTVNMSRYRIRQKSSVVNISGTVKTILSGGTYYAGSLVYLSSVDIFDVPSNTFTMKNISTPRFYHTSTALPNGNIVIAGGSDAPGGNILDTLEMYNSSTNSFVTLTPRMSYARYYFTATYIPSIRSILFAGGYISANLNSYDLFNVTTMQFVRNGTLKYARSTHTATLLQDGRVLLAGGYPQMNQVEIFDPSTFTTSIAANLSIGRCYHTATLLTHSSQVLVCGGQNTVGYLASCELYAP